jgi:hypothetical protein
METSEAGIVDLLRALLEPLPRGEQLFVIALLEAGSGQRYRAWADEADDEETARGLRSCAAREEEIARRLRATLRDELTAPADLDRLVGRIQDVSRSVFADRSARERFALQAVAERGGASVWRELGTAEVDAARAGFFGELAALEEESAAFLETLVG